MSPSCLPLHAAYKPHRLPSSLRLPSNRCTACDKSLVWPPSLSRLASGTTLRLRRSDSKTPPLGILREPKPSCRRLASLCLQIVVPPATSPSFGRPLSVVSPAVQHLDFPSNRCTACDKSLVWPPSLSRLASGTTLRHSPRAKALLSPSCLPLHAAYKPHRLPSSLRLPSNRCTACDKSLVWPPSLSRLASGTTLRFCLPLHAAYKPHRLPSSLRLPSNRCTACDKSLVWPPSLSRLASGTTLRFLASGTTLRFSGTTLRFLASGTTLRFGRLRLGSLF